MDILVEDGTGLVTANAYASVEEVDDLLSVNIHSQWNILDEGTKESLIMWATRVLDERVKWKGKKVHGTSALAWPRECVKDREGFPIDDDIVPRQVKLATAILADSSISADPQAPNSAANLKSIKADVVELVFDSRLTTESFPVELKFILSGLGTLSFGRGFKNIVKH